MDIDRIHYFCVVAQAGSLVKASELLNISQPALSKALKTLESELGQKIVVPSGRGIAVTDYGKMVAAEAAPLIEKMFALKTLTAENHTRSQLRVATFEVFSTYFLGKVIAEEFSNIDICLFELNPGSIEEAVASGQADVGITCLPIAQPDLDILKITSMTMGIYGISRAFGDVPFESLPFVVPNTPVSGTPSQAKSLDGWPDHEMTRNIKYRVTMMETALDLCRRGKCVGYLPKFVVELHNKKVKTDFTLELVSKPVKLQMQKQDVYLLKRKSDPETSHFKKMARSLRMVVS